ncbi:hypothetical protein EPI10_027006 [Gossypium australe]|uniref:Uncharacterized protein n=1 Tax=Gossypium australe TaxID=47621 RepID=A0A5B6USW6_9ROSI|nr:hypothetical protein EPI10_027006 [Gossypium australe]
MAQAGEKDRACHSNLASDLPTLPGFDRNLQSHLVPGKKPSLCKPGGVFSVHHHDLVCSCQLQEPAGIHLWELLQIRLRFLDASAWTLSTGKEPANPLLTTFMFPIKLAAQLQVEELLNW